MRRWQQCANRSIQMYRKEVSLEHFFTCITRCNQRWLYSDFEDYTDVGGRREFTYLYVYEFGNWYENNLENLLTYRKLVNQTKISQKLIIMISRITKHLASRIKYLETNITLIITTLKLILDKRSKLRTGSQQSFLNSPHGTIQAASGDQRRLSITIKLKRRNQLCIPYNPSSVV